MQPRQALSATRRLAVTGLLLVVAGCATTRVHSALDPQARGRRFHRVLIAVEFEDLALRQTAERELQRRLVERGVDARAASGLFFAAREYPDAEIQQTLNAAGIEALLVIGSAESGTTEHWVPQRTTTTSKTTVEGKTIEGRSTTTTSGGYYRAKPWATYRADLHDRAAGRVVWFAEMDAGGSSLADWDDLARSMARATARQLVQDGVLR
jgi:hypothetical protein